MKIFLNVYEEIIANTVLNYQEDLIQLRNFLRIFSDDFNKYYNFVYLYYTSYKTLPDKKIVKEEFENLKLREGNSAWALAEQEIYWKKEKYKDILIKAVSILEKREFDENELKKQFMIANEVELKFAKEYDYQELAAYIKYKTKPITDMENFAKWIGSGIDYPSFNQIFANLHNGKTMFMYKLAAELIKLKKKVLFISSEMKWQTSIVLIYQFMTKRKVKTLKDLPPRDFQKIQKYLTVPPKDDYIYDSINYIETSWRKHDVCIFDSYYELTTAGSGGDEYGAINAITQYLVNSVHRPVFVTTQAKDIAEAKKITEVNNYDTSFTKRGSQASDYNGFLRLDKNGVVNLINLKGRNRDFTSSSLPDIIRFNMNVGEGIFQEISETQSKFF